MKLGYSRMELSNPYLRVYVYCVIKALHTPAPQPYS